LIYVLVLDTKTGINGNSSKTIIAAIPEKVIPQELWSSKLGMTVGL